MDYRHASQSNPWITNRLFSDLGIADRLVAMRLRLLRRRLCCREVRGDGAGSRVARIQAGLNLGITLRRLSRHTGENDRRLCRMPKIPRRLERTPDVRVFRAAIECYQPHAVRALHLMSLTEPLRPFGEGLLAVGTLN